jgi:hypothetical protein
MKLRIAALVALVAVIAAVVVIGGWWYVKDRERIGQTELQTTVASKTGGTKATCLKRDSNAAHWLCAVITTGAPARCFRAHVRPWGSVEIVNGYRKCLEDPALRPLVEKKRKKKKAERSKA